MGDSKPRLRLLTRKSSPTMSSFNPVNILPEPDLPRLDSPQHKLLRSQRDGAPAFGTDPMSAPGSASPPSVFDAGDEQPEYRSEPTTALDSGSGDEPGSYDLKPPPPSVSHDNIEALSGRFFSQDHLDIILRDQNLSSRFTKFLNQYRSHHAPTLARYLETKKAMCAIEYANSLAEHLPAEPGHPPFFAATLDDRFEAQSRRIVEDLVDDALPAYVTHRLVQLVTDTLVKEITGNGVPIMRDLIPSLAEVYCVSDPSLPDNPIVYASEEFYNTSQYGRDYVIGRNCRFLQGPKTSNSTVRRLIDALAAGQEICETILNYRRDGSPFMNLLMIAPLYDNKGNVRYFLGCQIDVSPLVEGGRGLESFAQLLTQDRTESRFGGRPEKDPKHVLGEFGQMLNEEEANIVKGRRRAYSDDGARPSTPKASSSSVRKPRMILGMEDTRALWPHPSLGASGRLPGVYQSYLLVRPFPSLRITFTSPALRTPGLLQTKFLDRIGGPTDIREGVLDALSQGTGVTAKISWLTNASAAPGEHGSTSMEGKPRWIHCTPLLGSDERVGVWMIVMVENEEVTGSLNRHIESGLGSAVQAGAANARFTHKKLYAEYLRREGGASMMAGSENSNRSARERRDIDNN